MRYWAILMLFVLCACGGGKNSGAKEEADSVTTARREALREFLALSKDRDKLERLVPSVFYRVLREGDGPVPTDTSMVTVHYEGRLKGGQVFDSSYDRGTPWTVRVDSTIAGWKDVLTHMPCGSKWFVYIDFDKAYGDQSVAGIPAMSNLYFTMELLEVRE